MPRQKVVAPREPLEGYEDRIGSTETTESALVYLFRWIRRNIREDLCCPDDPGGLPQQPPDIHRPPSIPHLTDGDQSRPWETGDVYYGGGVEPKTGPRGPAETVPVGTIVMWAGKYIPPGWLPCDGRAIGRRCYAELFRRCGTTWGVGDGLTTFNIPDMRNKMPQGAASSTAVAAAGADYLKVTPASSIDTVRVRFIIRARQTHTADSPDRRFRS